MAVLLVAVAGALEAAAGALLAAAGALLAAAGALEAAAGALLTAADGALLVVLFADVELLEEQAAAPNAQSAAIPANAFRLRENFITIIPLEVRTSKRYKCASKMKA
jgi:hypothetical protein